MTQFPFSGEMRFRLEYKYFNIEKMKWFCMKGTSNLFSHQSVSQSHDITCLNEEEGLFLHLCEQHDTTALHIARL